MTPYYAEEDLEYAIPSRFEREEDTAGRHRSPKAVRGRSRRNKKCSGQTVGSIRMRRSKRWS